ncbi:Cytochrome c oxidase, subunit VB [Operophtera brumata]|uniref:Cytochrome c oxidase, subunit VB n=1 Tax=Operophtera brumata TaxID=104452 RepID=A0A0L7KRU6_OPEBR|nr:Cytochrome c oxidase, subunit VB [Operophtera brumata]
MHDHIDHVTGLEKREFLAHMAGNCDPWRILAIKKGARLYGEMHDHIDHVTGLEKREFLAHMAGNCDPWRILAIKKGPGTRERPNLIPSCNESRLMCCHCTPHDNHLEFMWLHQGCPKRCGCGFWFELCPIAPM